MKSRKRDGSTHTQRRFDEGGLLIESAAPSHPRRRTEYRASSFGNYTVLHTHGLIAGIIALLQPTARAEGAARALSG